MLKNLFISKVRISLLKQFLFNMGQEYHVRGLVRILGEEINAVRRELLNLKDAGILKSERKGNKLIYKIDKKCTITHELKSMLYKDSDLGREFINIAQTLPNIHIVILTESYMTKNYESSIDVDLLFIGEADIHKLSTFMKDIEKTLGEEIRYSYLTMKDFEFGKKKRDPFLLNILGKDKILLLGDESSLAI